MVAINTVVLIGNLTKDPGPLSHTRSGVAVTVLRIAVNSRVRTPGGGFGEETCFVNVTVRGRAAENAARTFRKGATVLVEGRLWEEEWESRGVAHSRIRLVADRVANLSD